jgi:predicted nucleotidyltransferase
MHLNKENIETIKRYFSQKPVLKAYIFGSQARGEADENSDIDLLVELDYSEKIGLLFLQMQVELEDLLHKKVDLVSSKGLSKYIKPTVDQEKRLIYAR